MNLGVADSTTISPLVHASSQQFLEFIGFWMNYWIMSLFIFVRGLSRWKSRLRPWFPPGQNLKATGNIQKVTSKKKREWFPYTPRLWLEKNASPSTDINFDFYSSLVVPNYDDSPRGGERGMSRDWKHVLASFSLKFKTEKDVQAPYGQLGKQSRKQPPDFSALKF